MAEISVIIALYNKGELVERAIDSVINQTYTDWSLVVVDDGSTDNSKDHVEKYLSDERVTYVWQENAGPGPARNTGIRNSSSKYVTFLDADDEWLPEFLQITIDALENEPGCDVVITGYYLDFIYENNVKIDNYNYCNWMKGKGWTDGVYRLSTNADDFELCYVLNHFHTGNFIVRRVVIEKYGGYYNEKNVVLGEDGYLHWLLIQNHTIYRILKPLSWYHLDDSALWQYRDVNYPIIPILKNCNIVLEHVLPGYERVVKKWLDIIAMGWAYKFISTGQPENSKWLIDNYPGMRRWKKNYLKLKVKMLWPSLFADKCNAPRRDEQVG